MRFILAALSLFISSALFSQQEHYLIIGTYTKGKSEGIYVYKFNSQTGQAKYVSSVKSSNPSFLVVSPDQNYVYAVNENSPGAVVSYSFDKKKGVLKELNSQPSKGNDPCYINTSKDGKFIVVGNYTSGTISVYPVKKDHSLDTAIQVIQQTGSSINKDRQESAHVHATVFSNDYKFLFVPDLGTDKLMAYSFHSATGKLSPALPSYITVKPGSGPRHFVFDAENKFAYLMEELSGTVEVFSYNNGKLNSIQTISSHPDNYTGMKGSADIHISPDGKFLYGSNRGESNSIAIFKINKATGKLTVIGYQSTLGLTPRNFNFDPSGNYLLAANQDSDKIVIFKINKQTGLLNDTGKSIEVGSPVCIKWIQ